jgi:hypothetical protein
MKKIMSLLVFFLIGHISFGQQDFPTKKIMSEGQLRSIVKSYHSPNPIKLNLFELDSKVLAGDIKADIIRMVQRVWTDAEINNLVEARVKANFERQYLEQILKTVKNKYDYPKQFYQQVYKHVYDSVLLDLIKDTTGFFSDTIRLKTVVGSQAMSAAATAAAGIKLSYDSLYRYTYDSTLREFKKNEEKKIKEAAVPDDLILAAGILKVKELEPLLQDAVDARVKYISSVTAEIALAGLNNRKARKKIIDQHIRYTFRPQWNAEEIQKDFFILGIVCRDQETFSLLADWLDTSKMYQPLSETPRDTAVSKKFYSAQVVPAILGAIKNEDFIRGYKEQSKPDKYYTYFDSFNVSKEQISYVKTWLLSNKGKYLFN